MEVYQSIIALFGGIGVFMVAMEMLSKSLEKMAGASMKNLLGKLTGNRFLGVLIGAIVTAIIQSSSATTVMIIGFVNSETMTLHQATATIMGANIGTTVTGLLASLQSLKISLYLCLLAFIGVVMMFFSYPVVKNVGEILAGLGMIFEGLDIMSSSVQTDKIKSAFSSALQKFDFPLLLVLLGAVLTGCIQSSSAMTGIVIILVQNEAIEPKDALFIVLGANIGTCVTALLSSVGANINARRASIIHLLFNVIGVVLFVIIVWSLQKYIVEFLESIASTPAMQIAYFHLFFNIITTLVLLPFISLLVKASIFIIRDSKNKNSAEGGKKMIKSLKYINKRFLFAPQIAIMQVKKEIKNMAFLVKTNFDKALEEFYNQDGIYCDEIFERGELIDFLRIETTKFLVKLAPKMDEKSGDEIATFFHLLNDIERIGVHSKNFLDDSKLMKKKEIKFSESAMTDLKEINLVVSKMFLIGIKAFDSISEKELTELDDLNTKVAELQTKGSQNHFDRLTEGKCNMEAGSFFISAYAHFNSIAAHLITIGRSFTNDVNNNKSLIGKEYLLVLNDNAKEKPLDTKSSTSNLNVTS